MKCFLYLVALAFTLSAHSQPSNEKLVEAIEKIERKEHSNDGEKITYLHVAILNDSIIPLRNWWKQILDVHLDFGKQMETLLVLAKRSEMEKSIDSSERKEMEKKLEAFKDSLANAASTRSSPEIAYFKKRYEQTPPSLNVYEVKYKLELQTSKGNFSRDYLRRVLNMEDLSDAGVPKH